MMIVIVLLLMIIQSLNGFTICNSNIYSIRNIIKLYDNNNNNNNKNNDKLQKWASAELKEGATHIKYNKYAPSSDEAANMSSVEFRKVIFDNMMKAEQERREQGVVGNGNSDAYFSALEGKPPAPSSSSSDKKKSFNPFQKK